ncbi:MAG: hypothetical protein HW390_112 [Candidatus Brocadiaceae bacterium]|nr:hypothetical protein [Candidatus Brocadiaceae bacterium]
MKAKTYDISLWERSLGEEYKERKKERLDILKVSVKALKRYFKGKDVKRVFLVGSILKKSGFYPFSDIDVAVGGLKEEYFKTLLGLEDVLERNVDLIEIEKCRFKDSLERKGLKIL